MKNWLGSALIIVSFAGCNLFSKTVVPSPTPAQAVPSILSAGNILENTKAPEVSFQLYRLLASDPKNINFSPLSLKISFSLLYPGSASETQKTLEHLFSFSQANPNPFHAEYELAQKIEDKKLETNQLEIHNSAWMKRANEVKPEFIESLKLQDAALGKVNLDAMNAWVAKATQNKIPKLIDSLPPQTNTVLINTLYFKQKWLSPFEVGKTTLAQFQVSPNQGQNVMTLHDHKEVNYFEDDRAKWVALPYENSPFIMYFSLPKKRFDLRSIEGNLTAASFLDLISKMKKSPVELAIPKFKFNQKSSMRALMTSAGYENLFTRGDYSGILTVHRLIISDILQATSIGVGEIGTEASAATGVILKEKAMRQNTLLSKSFIADQPFLFILRNEETKEIYWLGRVYSPRTAD